MGKFVEESKTSSVKKINGVNFQLVQDAAQEIPLVHADSNQTFAVRITIRFVGVTVKPIVMLALRHLQAKGLLMMGFADQTP